MSLSSTLSAGNLTKIRSENHWRMQYVVTVPDTIVVQFQADSAPTTSIYAEIVVGTVASGSMSDVKSLMTVIYSDTSDYRATEKYRTYVRKVSGTATLYVGQNGQSLTTSQYVTVLNAYEPHEKPRTQRGGTEYADWDIPFRRVPPVETALPMAVVLTDGTTAWTPTAVPAAIDADATGSFTHAWESSNSNDTLDSGGSTASPSWTFQAASHRWIRYTFTDSNGNANIRIISIWTVPVDLSSPVNGGFIGAGGDVADIGYSQGDGWTCSLPAYTGVDTLRSGVMVCVFNIESYNGVVGSLDSNIAFIGYVGAENTDTQGDEQFGVLSEVSFTLNGIGTLMSVLPISPVAIVDDSTPTAWSEIESPTPVRALVYLLTEHTTIFNLCPFSFPSNHTDFIAPGRVFESGSDVIMDAARYQADAMDCILQFARDGRIDMQRNLVQDDDTARDGADVIVTFTPADYMDFSLEFDPVKQIKFYQLHAGVYTTASGTYDVYQAFVPPLPDNRGTVTEQRTNVILTTNSSLSDALAEFADRAANLYAAMNPAPILRCTLKPEWHFLQPDVGAWHKHTIAVTDTVRGIAYDSTTRWQLIELSAGANNETGDGGGVSAVFRIETQNTGANIEVAKLRKPTTSAAAEYSFKPAIFPPGVSGDLETFTDGEWYDSVDPGSPDDPIPPETSTCEVFGFNVPNGGTGFTTAIEADASENIAVTVRGSGKLSDGTGGATTYDFATGQNGFGVWNGGGSGVTAGQYNAGAGYWEDTDATPAVTWFRQVGIRIDFAETVTLLNIEVELDINFGGFEPAAGTIRGFFGDQGGNSFEIFYAGDYAGDGTTLSWSGSRSTAWLGVFQYVSIRFDQSNLAGYGRIRSVVITTEPTGQEVYGDAFYTGNGAEFASPTPIGSGSGFLINGSSPATIPPYNANHEYAVAEVASAGAVDLTYVSPHGNSNAENAGISGEICFNGA